MVIQLILFMIEVNISMLLVFTFSIILIFVHYYLLLTHRCSNCAKASLYKKMRPQLLNVKLAGSPKRKAYSYIAT